MLALPLRAAETTTVELSFSGRALIYKGELSAAANQRLFELYEQLPVKPQTLVISSAGGRVELGLELGEWVFRQQLKVHVPSFCNSACANYVFTAARERELGENALLSFHGGMRDADTQLQASLARLTPVVREKLLPEKQRFLTEMLARESAFFQTIGVDQAITSYGYQNRYAQIIRSYPVWNYSLAMLADFGVDNVQVTDDAAWFPLPLQRGILLIDTPDTHFCIPPGKVIASAIAC